MMSILRTLVAGSALALGTASLALPFAMASAARTTLTDPAKLWAGFNSPAGAAFDAAGNLHVAEWGAGRVSRIDPAGVGSTFADGLCSPSGLAIGADGAIYVASYSSDMACRLTPDGQRIEAGAAFGTPGPGVAMTKESRVFVVDYGGTTVREILPDGQSLAVADGLKSPVGLTVSFGGQSLLAAAWGDGAIYRIAIPK